MKKMICLVFVFLFGVIQASAAEKLFARLNVERTGMSVSDVVFKLGFVFTPMESLPFSNAEAEAAFSLKEVPSTWIEPILKSTNRYAGTWNEKTFWNLDDYVFRVWFRIPEYWERVINQRVEKFKKDYAKEEGLLPDDNETIDYYEDVMEELISEYEFRKAIVIAEVDSSRY
jgi:hypothetical protein